MDYDLLVCIRCHKNEQFVLDTLSSAEWSCGHSCKVVCAVDGNPRFARKLADIIGNDRVYNSPSRHGWGAGLYDLLIESIVEFKTRFPYEHFLSVDYDTLFIGRGADEAILGKITDEKVGLVGNHNTNNLRWADVFRKERDVLARTLGKIPATYIPGEGVQGGCMLLTSSLIRTMNKRGFFFPPHSRVKSFTSIADDHFLPLITRMCGLEIVDSADCTRSTWRATAKPNGLEEKGIKIFHPTKLSGGPGAETAEYEVRNYYRRKRGLSDLLQGKR